MSTFNAIAKFSRLQHVMQKNHDYCYEMRELRNFTHEFCDARFRGCLFDMEDLHSDGTTCDVQQAVACKAVQGFIGDKIYKASGPKNWTKTYENFTDTKPLGLEMKKLVDACPNAKGMAVHCHNMAYLCLENDKKRNGAPIVGDSKDDEPCPSMARKMSNQVAGRLSVETYGAAAIEIYPIISKRLVENCNTGVEMCLISFDECASNPANREERPEYFNAGRRVKVGCHQKLRACIERATEGEVNAKCVEAKRLALSRIRDREKTDIIDELLWKVHPVFDAVKGTVDYGIDCVKDITKCPKKLIHTGEEVVEKAKDIGNKIIERIG